MLLKTCQAWSRWPWGDWLYVAVFSYYTSIFLKSVDSAITLPLTTHLTIHKFEVFMIGIVEKKSLLTQENPAVCPTFWGVMSPGASFSHWFLPSVLVVHKSHWKCHSRYIQTWENSGRSVHAYSELMLRSTYRVMMVKSVPFSEEWRPLF